MPRITGEKESGGVQSVVLALKALEYLAGAADPVGVTELADILGTTKTRIHRHLRTLLQQGYVTQSARTGRYMVGTRLVTLGRQVAESMDLSATAMPYLRDLRERLGQTCVLSQLEHDGARILQTLSGRSPIEIGVKPGSVLPFHDSAQGKVMLAHVGSEFRDRILSQPLPASTAHTITDPAVLTAELAAIRARGWAVAPNESATGLNALAAPLFDDSGAVVGALAIVDLVQFLPAKPAREQLQVIVGAASAISAALGHTGATDGDERARPG
jgi:DNA-binding IclR family transcriptional regulator